MKPLAVLALTATLVFAVTGTPAALAAPPNDDFPGTTIPSLPFDGEADSTGATLEPGEPFNANEGNSAWYTFTAGTDGVVEANTAGGISATVAAYTGDSVADLDEVAAGGGRIRFAVIAGTVYRIRVAESGFPAPVGVIRLALISGVAPPNDDFPGRVVNALPFADNVDTTFATVERDEASVSGATVWYQFTATSTVDVLSDTRGSSYAARVSVYTDETLDIPGGIGSSTVCALGNVRLDRVAAGQTVYFQVGTPTFPGDGGTLQFSLKAGTAADVAAACPTPTPVPQQSPGPTVVPSPPRTGSGLPEGDEQPAALLAAFGAAVLSGAVAAHALLRRARRRT